MGHDSSYDPYFANPRPPNCVPPMDDQDRVLKPAQIPRSDKTSVYSDNDPGTNFGGIVDLEIKTRFSLFSALYRLKYKNPRPPGSLSE